LGCVVLCVISVESHEESLVKVLGSQASSPNGDRIVLCRGRPALRAVAILITTGLIALLLAVGSTGTNMAGSAVAFAIPISLVLTIQITGFTAKVTASGDWLEIDGFFAMERVHVSAIRFVDGEAGFRVHLWNGASVAFVGLGGSLLGAITKERYARRGAAAVNVWLDTRERPQPSLGQSILRQRRLRRDFAATVLLPIAAGLLVVLYLKLLTG